LPNQDSIQSDLTGSGYTHTSERPAAAGEQGRDEEVQSPDEGGAIALCFSEPGGSPVVYDSNLNRRIEYSVHGFA
jgi:hypothetical protein